VADSLANAGGGVGGFSTSTRSRSLNSYPNPHFDLSSQDIPLTIKELFRHCLFLYLSHSEIASLINKKCSYVITDLVYETESAKVKKVWKELFEQHLNIPEFEYMMLLDLEIFGNAFCSFFFPFERGLECKKCEKTTDINDDRMQWHYREHKFVGKCPECKKTTQFEVKDQPIKHKKKTKLIRWFPEYMQILKNEVTGNTKYIYKIPKWMRNAVKRSEKDANKYLVEDMPMVFLNAIKRGEDVLLDPETFYHMKIAGPSYYDQTFGIPPMLAIMKDAWLYQTYRRAQEAIAVEHILPLRILIPRPVSGDHSPHIHNDLGQWSHRMQNMISKWRRDPNAIFTAPFPCEVQNIGGQAQALQVHNDMTQLRQSIAVGLDIPADLIYGSMSWSGSSVTLRMLENQFLTRIAQLDRLLYSFLVPKLRAWLDLPDISIKHRDFKMADDAQQKQIALSLRQTNTISDQTVIQELGFDYSEEQERKRKEEDDRNAVLLRQMVSQAEAQGQAQSISAKWEAIAAQERENAAKQAQERAELESYGDAMMDKTEAKIKELASQAGKVDGADIGGSGLQMTSEILDTLAENTIKAVPPEQMDNEMLRLSKKNPQLAAAIQKRLARAKESSRAVQPLPEQRAPRSSKAGI